MSRNQLLSIFLFVAVGCGGSGDGDDTTTDAQVQGVATYRDATTDASGTPRERDVPPAQTADVSVTVRGNGTLSGLDPTCLDSATGQFQALYTGTAELSGDGAYVSNMASAEAVLQTPSGCAIPELTVGAFTDVVIRAELEATTANCDTYCAASARADAEAACSAAPDRVACWTDAEATAKASCDVECTTQSEHIVAEVTLSGNVLGELDADALAASAFGQLDADLMFSALE